MILMWAHVHSYLINMHVLGLNIAAWAREWNNLEIMGKKGPLLGEAPQGTILSPCVHLSL